MTGDPSSTEYPYEQKPNQRVQLDKGKCRHVASVALEMNCDEWAGMGQRARVKLSQILHSICRRTLTLIMNTIILISIL